MSALKTTFRYPWPRLTRKGVRVTVKEPGRGARMAAEAYAGRHGFAISMWKTTAGDLVVERTR